MYPHQIINKIIVVKVEGNLALTVPYDFKSFMIPLLENSEVEGLIVNFQKLNFIDSYGIGVIVSLFKSSGEMGKTFALSNLKPNHQKLFETTKLDLVIDIFDSEEMALEKMGG